MPAAARARPGCGWEPGAPFSPLMWVAGPRVLGPSSTTFQPHQQEAQSEVWSGPDSSQQSRMGCGQPRLQLYLLLHTLTLTQHIVTIRSSLGGSLCCFCETLAAVNNVTRNSGTSTRSQLCIWEWTLPPHYVNNPGLS